MSFLSAMGTLAKMFFALFLVAVGLNLGLGTWEAIQSKKRQMAVQSDIQLIGEQLKRIEKEKSQIQIQDLQKVVTLSPGTRWEDFTIHPFTPDNTPFVEYRAAEMIAGSYDTYMFSYRSGSIQRVDTPRAERHNSHR